MCFSFFSSFALTTHFFGIFFGGNLIFLIRNDIALFSTIVESNLRVGIFLLLIQIEDSAEFVILHEYIVSCDQNLKIFRVLCPKCPEFWPYQYHAAKSRVARDQSLSQEIIAHYALLRLDVSVT